MDASWDDVVIKIMAFILVSSGATEEIMHSAPMLFDYSATLHAVQADAPYDVKRKRILSVWPGVVICIMLFAFALIASHDLQAWLLFELIWHIEIVWHREQSIHLFVEERIAFIE